MQTPAFFRMTLRVLVASVLASVLLTLPTSPVSANGNDPLLPQQWGLTAIEAPAAWANSRGAGVIVAVLDTGSGPHPDLDANLLAGRSFLNGGNSPGGADQDGHGTHVAGIIAAVANNGIGISGVAPEAKILPLQVLAPEGRSSSGNVANAVRYAVEQGAKVINLSLGGTTQSLALTDAIDYALSRDVLVVAAAGNSGPNAVPKWPAAGDNTIAVTAVTSDRSIAALSQRGDYIDISAPGTSIVSTVDNDWWGYSGTSMATAFVSGVAALLYSAKPTASAVEVRNAIESSALDLGDPGKDQVFGFGLVNARAALQTLLASTNPPLSSVELLGATRVGETLQAAGGQPVRWWRCRQGGPVTSTRPTGCTPIRRRGQTYTISPADVRHRIRVSYVLDGQTNFSAASEPIVAIWPVVDTVVAGTRLPVRAIVATGSRGTLAVKVDGACTYDTKGRIVTFTAVGSCTVTVTVTAQRPYPRLRTKLNVTVAP